jgi:uncharacterized peroxidase-related enzyme
MSRFDQIKEPRNHPDLEALYQEIIDNGFGKDVPVNWFTAQSERPDILATTWGFVKGILLQGMLPPTVKQMISLIVSMYNNCRYCTVAHTKALEAMGVPTEVIDSVTTDLNLAEVPPPQRAILQFALKAAQAPESVTDDDYHALREHGLNNGEIMEVAMMAAFTNFINAWAEVSGIPVDAEELL